MKNPFQDITETGKTKLLNLLGSHIYSYNKDQKVLDKIKNENIICIMLEGDANIIHSDYDGNNNLVENLTPNTVFGTNISSIDNEEYVIISTSTSKVLVIDYNQLLKNEYTKYNYYNVFLNNLFDIVASKLKDKNDRIRILTQKTIRDKFLEYFEIEYKKRHSKYIYLSGSFKDLADYFAVNRSALFRELRSLKDEKFIEVDGKKITLLYNPLL